jgi:hypothetical protein
MTDELYYVSSSDFSIAALQTGSPPKNAVCNPCLFLQSWCPFYRHFELTNLTSRINYKIA